MKVWRTAGTAALVLTVLFGVMPVLGAQSKGTTMSVQVKSVDLRTDSGVAGKPLGIKLAYGDRVVVEEKKGAWIKVKTEAGTLGWVSASALTSKRVVLDSSRDTKTSASSSEVALAGKGFNKEVEAKYQAGGKVDYTWVNLVENWNPQTAKNMGRPEFSPSAEDLYAFIASGGMGGK